MRTVLALIQLRRYPPWRRSASRRPNSTWVAMFSTLISLSIKPYLLLSNMAQAQLMTTPISERPRLRLLNSLIDCKRIRRREKHITSSLSQRSLPSTVQWASSLHHWPDWQARPSPADSIIQSLQIKSQCLQAASCNLSKRTTSYFSKIPVLPTLQMTVRGHLIPKPRNLTRRNGTPLCVKSTTSVTRYLTKRGKLITEAWLMWRPCQRLVTLLRRL